LSRGPLKNPLKMPQIRSRSVEKRGFEKLPVIRGNSEKYKRTRENSNCCKRKIRRKAQHDEKIICIRVDQECNFERSFIPRLPKNEPPCYIVPSIRNWVHSRIACPGIEEYKELFKKIYSTLKNREQFYLVDEQEIKRNSIELHMEEVLRPILLLALHGTLLKHTIYKSPRQSAIELSSSSGLVYYVYYTVIVGYNRV